MPLPVCDLDRFQRPVALRKLDSDTLQLFRDDPPGVLLGKQDRRRHDDAAAGGTAVAVNKERRDDGGDGRHPPWSGLGRPFVAVAAGQTGRGKQPHGGRQLAPPTPCRRHMPGQQCGVRQHVQPSRITGRWACEQWGAPSGWACKPPAGSDRPSAAWVPTQTTFDAGAGCRKGLCPVGRDPTHGESGARR